MSNEQIWYEIWNATGWLGAYLGFLHMFGIIGLMSCIWLWVWLSTSRN